MKRERERRRSEKQRVGERERAKWINGWERESKLAEREREVSELMEGRERKISIANF